MKKVLSFFKLTALGGLLVLLPILLFILLLIEIVQMVVGLATPIAGLFPGGTLDDAAHPVVLAVILLFGASMLIGIVMKSEAAKGVGGWIEKKTFGNLPIYRFAKTLVSGLVGAEKAAGFQPGLFDAGNGLQEIVYVVEDLGKNGFTVLFPRAPTGFAGPVKIVPRDRIAILNGSLGDVSLVMNHMGLGAGRLMKMVD
jgi:uncharacterized membrane protein